MSEFIKAIEFDQTPVRAAMQWSSSLADEANRAAASRQAAAKLRADQDAAIAETFQGLSKIGAERLKGLPQEFVNNGMTQLQENLTQALLKSKGDPNVFRMLGYDKAFKDLMTSAAGMEQVVSSGDAIAKEFGAKGYRPDAIKAFTAKYVLKPGQVFNPEEFKAALEKDVVERPHIYNDLDGLKKSLLDRAEEKGTDFIREETQDPTGKRKLTATIGTKVRPWEVIGKKKMDNGLEIEVPMLSTEVVKGPAGEFNVVKGDVMTKYIGDDPTRARAVSVAAKQSIHDINRSLGINTAAMTREEFEAAKSKNQNLVDPFSEENLLVFSRKNVTDILSKYYDKDGFAPLAKSAEGDVKDNPPKAPTVNVNTGSGDQGFIDQYSVIEEAVKSGPKVRIKGKPIGTPLNMLDSGQDYLIDIANKAGGRGAEGQEKYNQENLILKKTPQGKIGIYQWNPENSTVGNLVSVVSKVPTNVKANQPLGTKAKGAAAGTTKPKTLAEQMREQANKK